MPSLEDLRDPVKRYSVGLESYSDTKESLLFYSTLVWDYFSSKLCTEAAKKESIIEDMKKELVIVRALAVKLKAKENDLKADLNEVHFEFETKLTEFIKMHIPEVSGYTCKLTHAGSWKPSLDHIEFFKEEAKGKEQIGNPTKEEMEDRCRTLDQELVYLEPKVSEQNSAISDFIRLDSNVKGAIHCMERSIACFNRQRAPVYLHRAPCYKREREGQTEDSTSVQKKHKCGEILTT